ncbi:hypothetical protein J32TS6_04750 [Virgibacillus pantothenticus]|nr:hypothetical protein BKP57_20580 [Virgibacillus sp. 6R]GIP61920.1 hypothetical protein J32TS6_04750 [Virgibacillus pantothenticus]
MFYKLTKDATPEQLKQAGIGEHFVDHDRALFYHVKELQYHPKPKRPDPVYAKKLQEIWRTVW